MYLICHVTLHEHIIQTANEFTGGSSLCYITTLISLEIINTVMMEMFLICHVTSREQIFKELCEFMGGSRSQWVTTLPYLVTTDLLQVEILSI